MKPRHIAATIALALTGCAETTLYRDGEPIARIQGDATDLRVQIAPDGTATLEAATLDHTTPTEARGKATAGRINAAGAALAGAAAALMTQ